MTVDSGDWAVEAGEEPSMVYEYEIYEPGSREKILAAFETAQPLPHVQVGHALWLTTPQFESSFSERLVISEVELAVTVADGGDVERLRVMIHLRVEDRTLG